LIKGCAYRHVRMQHENARNMMSSRQVRPQVNGHRFTIACHQHKAIGFAPEKNLWIERSMFWRTWIADPPDHKVRRMPYQLGPQGGINILIEQVANGAHLA
jgi:hypothetical protein